MKVFRAVGSPEAAAPPCRKLISEPAGRFLLGVPRRNQRGAVIIDAIMDGHDER